jgi:hypothetical protein
MLKLLIDDSVFALSNGIESHHEFELPQVGIKHSHRGSFGELMDSMHKSKLEGGAKDALVEIHAMCIHITVHFHDSVDITLELYDNK